VDKNSALISKKQLCLLYDGFVLFNLQRQHALNKTSPIKHRGLHANIYLPSLKRKKKAEKVGFLSFFETGPHYCSAS
jgi:hypothetical protein